MPIEHNSTFDLVVFRFQRLLQKDASVSSFAHIMKYGPLDHGRRSTL